VGNSWYSTGYPEAPKATRNQKLFLLHREKALNDILVPEERIAVTLMTFEGWINSVDKYGASKLIGRLLGEDTEIVEKRVKVPDKNKWWDTGLVGDVTSSKKKEAKSETCSE